MQRCRGNGSHNPSMTRGRPTRADTSVSRRQVTVLVGGWLPMCECWLVSLQTFTQGAQERKLRDPQCAARMGRWNCLCCVEGMGP